ncbi:MAG: polyprenyl synthetase family protein [Actinomycetota bacterium]|nr:polyprenyl synthetase family protein [Actinomycetota bacterium]
MSELLVGPSWLVDDLVRVEDLMRATVGASEHRVVQDAALHLIKAGGKRLRPALVLISSRAGKAGATATDQAAAAIELVHLATLYHDDVIDKTEVRRGAPTAHVLWGNEVAVLVGDYLFACGCGLGARAKGDVPQLLADAIVNVCEGQITETISLGDPHRPVDDYLATIRAKTAALFATGCELGAHTSGAEDARPALRSYGENLGMAFQVVDDLIDLVGDVRTTGKEPGTDLREGVFTAPLLLAAERDAAFAESLVSGERHLEGALEVLRSSGALHDAFEMAESFGADAVASLSGLPEDEWTLTLEKVVKGVLAQLPELQLR